MKLDVPDDPQAWSVHELATWFTPNLQQIRDVRKALSYIERRLSDAVRALGPMDVNGERLELLPDGYQWDDARVVEAMPILVKKSAVTFTGSKTDIERTLSLITEEQPDLSYEIEHTVDHVAATRVINAGGEAAEKLAPLRLRKTRLGVSR